MLIKHKKSASVMFQRIQQIIRMSLRILNALVQRVLLSLSFSRNVCGKSYSEMANYLNGCAYGISDWTSC